MADERHRVCDTCKGTRSSSGWIEVELTYRRKSIESHERSTFCSYSCYLVDLVSQSNLVKDQIREEGRSIPKIGG